MIARLLWPGNYLLISLECFLFPYALVCGLDMLIRKEVRWRSNAILIMLAAVVMQVLLATILRP